MTGAVAPTIRKGLWQEKRVFFLTPQTLEQDLYTGDRTYLSTFSSEKDMVNSTAHQFLCLAKVLFTLLNSLS